jgi:hypothetical protein
LPRGVLGALRREYGKKLIVRRIKIPKRKQKGREIQRSYITIHQPKQSTLAFLSNIQSNLFVIHAVHVATDFLCQNANDASLATEYLTRNSLLKWRRGEQLRMEVDTRYWNRNDKSRRNVALYGDRLSKTGRGHCSHFELRFTSASACKRVQLGTFSQLLGTIDASALLERHTKLMLVDAKLLDRALDRLAEKNRRRCWKSDMDVSQIKARIQRFLVRCLHDEEFPLSEHSLAKAISQSVWDASKGLLRGCLRKRSWSEFTPPPQWHCW